MKRFLHRWIILNLSILGTLVTTLAALFAVIQRDSINAGLVGLSITYALQVCITLDDQTQVDSKPAGQPEHASLNQCQLIDSNRPLWAPPDGGGDKVSL